LFRQTFKPYYLMRKLFCSKIYWSSRLHSFPPLTFVLPGLLFYCTDRLTTSAIHKVNKDGSKNSLVFVSAKSISDRSLVRTSIVDTSITERSIVDTSIAEGRLLLSASDCYSCHADHKTLTAPSYNDIAERYKNDTDAVNNLAAKVIKGSKGVWGETVMPAHPELLEEDSKKMIRYILHLQKMRSVQSPSKRN